MCVCACVCARAWIVILDLSTDVGKVMLVVLKNVTFKVSMFIS